MYNVLRVQVLRKQRINKFSFPNILYILCESVCTLHIKSVHTRERISMLLYLIPVTEFTINYFWTICFLNSIIAELVDFSLRKPVVCKKRN